MNQSNGIKDEIDVTQPVNKQQGRAQLLEAIRCHYREVMDPHFPIGSRVALIDFPNHGNVGDSAIWLGEIRYFEQRKVNLVYVCTKDTCHIEKLRARLGGDGIIAVHGGGNFGDLWPQHHEFFHLILQNFPNHKIVQLPQTAFWTDSDKRLADFERMNEHPNLTLFARDRTSLRILQENCRHPAHLCPDSAMLLDLSRPKAPDRELVALMRADKERGSAQLQPPVPVEDWTKDGSDLGFRFGRFLQRQLAKRGGGAPEALLNFLADARVKRGCLQMGRGRVVVTDRLHVHILACLMDIPHVLIDNSYGKLSTYRDCWTKSFARHVYLTQPSDLLAAIEAIQQDTP